VWCKKWSNWTSGVGEKIRLPVLSGIRLRPKTSDSLRLRLRNPGNNTTILCIWAGRLYESGHRKRMKKKKVVFNWSSTFHWQTARNNARPLEIAKLRWKAILSVLDPTFGCCYKISRKTDIACWNTLCLVKSARSVSRVLYLEKRVYIGLTSYG